MNSNPEKSAASRFSALFQHIIHNMKRMMPLWEEFIVKTNKLSISLRSTIVSLSSFLDTLQKIADIATGARGATKDIGSGLTRLGLRHRSIENKLKIYSSGLVESIASPIQEKLEEWKKLLILLDKEHSRDHKKSKQELHKLSTEMIALQNKVRKGKPEAQGPLSEIMYDLKTKSYRFEEFEKSAVRSALVEERTRFCVFVSCLKPVMDMEISVLSELTHIQEAMDSLCLQAGDPNSLPSSSEHIIKDIQDLQTDWFCQPSPLLSKHCSSSHSVNSTQSSPVQNASHLKINSDDVSQKSSHKPPFTASLSSASNDSGFVGQDFSSFAISRSESWRPTRQRSWTGLAQFHFGRDAVQKAASSPTPSNSGRGSGRKDCPDVVNAVDDLVFRSSVHASSLPPTPNPYAVPSFLNQIEGNNLLLKNLNSNSKGQHQMMTSPNIEDALSTGIWTANSFAVFEDEFAHNCLMQDLEHGRSTNVDADEAEDDDKGSSDNVDANGLAAALQRLEWPAAALDGTNNPSYNSKYSTLDENSEDEELQIVNNDGDSVASKNFSKPPVSRILRRGSMQGARKPPTPLRRMSSVTGSPQVNLQSMQGTSVCGSDSRMAKHHQPPLSATTNAAVAECYVAAESSKCVVASSSSACLSGREDRHGNGRRIPRINRATSQSLRKNAAPEESEKLPELRRERSRLPCRSLSDTHAEIIQTLNEKFLLRPTTGSLAPSERNIPSRISVSGIAACKPSVAASRSFKSLQVLCQIPEGVRVYRGVATSLASTNKNSPMGIGKKSS